MTWEQETIQKVLLETVKEQRRARRWKIFFRLLLICIIGGGIYMASGGEEATKKDGPQVAVVDFKGVISSDTKNYEIGRAHV